MEGGKEKAAETKRTGRGKEDRGGEQREKRVHLAWQKKPKKREFDQILKFGGSHIQLLSPIRAKYGIRQCTHCIHFLAKYHTIVARRKTAAISPYLTNFELWGLPQYTLPRQNFTSFGIYYYI